MLSLQSHFLTQVAEPGSVLFNFQRVGAILVDKTTEDAVFEAAMEAGADDVAPMPEDEDGNPSSSYRVRARCVVNYQARSGWPRCWA